MFNIVSTILKGIKRSRRTRTHLSQENYEFLPGHLEVISRPPSPFALHSAAALSMLVFIALAWSMLGMLDINATALGRTIVSSHSKVIQAFMTGEVAEIYVKDGQLVEEGEPLLIFNSIDVQAEIEELSQQLIYKQLQASQLDVLIQAVSNEPRDLDDELVVQAPSLANSDQILFANQDLKSDWNEIRAQLKNFNGELAVNSVSQVASRAEKLALQTLLENISARLDASYRLYQNKQIARVTYLEQKKEQLQTQLALTEKNNQLLILQEQAISIEAKRNSYLTQTLREYYDRLSTTKLEIATLSQRLLQATNKNRQHTLHAPVKGVVQQLAVHTIGGVVQPAQALMVIVPEEAALEVEAMVLNKDVGFIVSGQDVEIKVDAFPYTRYGTISGEVIHISKDAIKDEQLGLVFPTKIRLDSSAIQVEDMPVLLQAGMSVNAEIRTGKRQVIDYLLSPLKQYQSEALSER